MEKVSIYSYLDYRKYVLDKLKEVESSGGKLSRNQIAKQIRVQPPYLSKVLSGRALFSEDQLYLLGRFFRLSSEEQNYLYQLSQFEKAGLEERKKEIKETLLLVQKKKLSTEEHIETEELDRSKDEARRSYYLDPRHLLVHVSLALDKYSTVPELLIDDLKLSQQDLDTIINNLRTLELVQNIGPKLVLTKYNVHLKKGSDLYVPHQNLMRQLTTQRMMNPEDDDYSLAISFSCSKEDKEKIKNLFLGFLKAFDDILGDAKDEEVYQLNFDLFQWL